VANIKSQIKRNRQNDKRRLRNRVYRGTARIAVKSARTAIDDGAPQSQAELMKAISALDKAAEKGVIHKNNAARRKSRLMKAFGKMVPAKVEEPVKAEAVVEPETGTKKAPAKKAAAKAAPKTEVVAEPKAEAKKAPAKKAPAKKTAAKKPATAAKKPAAKKKA
jgi:small subunit ribosomal protein S20